MTRWCPHCGGELPAAADLLLSARSAAGLTQAAAARLLGMPRQNLCAWESGRRVPTPGLLRHALLELSRAARSSHAPQRQRRRRALDRQHR